MAGRSRTSGLSVTSRALALLTTFDEQHTWQSLSELARRSGTPLATCHRLARELLAWGALTRNGQGRFAVGQRIWELGLVAPVNRELRHLAAPYLQDIYLATRCIVHLVVRDDLHTLHVERISGRESTPSGHEGGGAGATPRDRRWKGPARLRVG